MLSQIEIDVHEKAWHKYKPQEMHVNVEKKKAAKQVDSGKRASRKSKPLKLIMQ